MFVFYITDIITSKNNFDCSLGIKQELINHHDLHFIQILL